MQKRCTIAMLPVLAALLFAAYSPLVAVAGTQGTIPLNRKVLTQNVRPNAGGWFQSQGNLGNINFDVSDSGIVAGNWSTFRDGKPIWYYFQGQIEYPDYAVSDADGVIAVAEANLAEVTGGGGCLSCPYDPAQFAPHGTMRIEFTSPRSGRFIYGRTTIPVLAWMQGLPLIARRDYSGEWLALVRRVAPEPDVPWRYDSDIQLIVTGRLDPMDDPDYFESYSSGPDETGMLDFAAAHRRYRFTCTKPDDACHRLDYEVFYITRECVSCIPDPRDFFALFLKDDDAGQFVPMKAWRDYQDRLAYTIHNDGRYWKAYGERDRILVRYAGEPVQLFEPYDYVLEIIMTRLPAGLFHSASPKATP